MKRETQSLKAWVDGLKMHPWSHALDSSDQINWIHGYTRLLFARDMRQRLRGEFRRPSLSLIRLTWAALSLRNAATEALGALRAGYRGRKQAALDCGQMMRLALSRNVNPFMYYIYQLYQPGNRVRVAEILDDWEFTAVVREISVLRALDLGILDNKRQFARFCRLHGLSGVAPWAPQDALARGGYDLFAKPAHGFGGEGCLKLEYDSQAQRWTLPTTTASAEHLHDALASHFGHRDFIVQECLRNHPSLRDLTGECLSTIRFLTGTLPDGTPTVFRATMRIAAPVSIVDNFGHGGMGAPIDLETGTLRAARKMKDPAHFNHHPTSGAVIKGRHLPDWEAAKDLVLRAQQAAEGFNLLGWDLAITERGPVLTECNVWSQIGIVQGPQGRGLLAEPAFLKCFLNEIAFLERSDRRVLPPGSPVRVPVQPDDWPDAAAV